MAATNDNDTLTDEAIRIDISENDREAKDKAETLDMNTTNGTMISEGKAKVCFPGAKDTVFYNPVQEFNRDLRYALQLDNMNSLLT